MEVVEEIVYCKSLWTLLSRSNYEISSDAIKIELGKAKSQLKEGLNYYRPPNEASDKILQSKLSENIFKFVTRLKIFLDLDAGQAWNLLSIYLLHEFHGSAVGLQHFVENEDLTENLIYDIWTFYSSERIFLLKCINYILVHHDDTEHPFKDNFKNVITSFEDLYYSLRSQLEFLTNKEGPTKGKYGPLMSERYKNMWIFYNLREQIEIIHNLILVTDMIPSRTPEDFGKLLKLCSENGFGEQKENWKLITDVPEDVCKTIGYLQNILLLATFVNESESNKKLYEDSTIFFSIEDTITSLGHAEEQSPIMLAWGIVNTLSNPDVHLLESYQLLSELSVRLGVFRYLKKCIESEIFQGPTKLSRVAYCTLYSLMTIIINNFDEATLIRMRGLGNLCGPVLSHPLIVKKFWKESKVNGLRLLFDLIALKFPVVDFLPFASAVRALTACDQNSAKKVHSEIMNMKTFGDQVTEEDINVSICKEMPSENYRLMINRKPMKFSEFTLPISTTGYFVVPPALEVCWHVEGFSMYEAVLNEQRTLMEEKMTSDEVDVHSVMENVITGLEIVNNILKAKICLSSELISVINYVAVMINRFKRIRRASASIFGVCLDILTTLISYDQMSVFTNLKQLQILPSLDNAPLDLSLISGNYLSVRTVGDWLYNEECPTGKYTVLKSYLNFLYKVVEAHNSIQPDVKLYGYSELILPGLVFILNEVFPRFQTWNYINEEEQVTVGAVCMKIFHEFLMVEDLKENRENFYPNLFRKLILHSVLYTPTGTALLKIVATGDPVIQGKVEQQYHWSTSFSTNVIYIVQLSLSLLNRVMLLKHLVQVDPLTSRLEMEIYSSPLKDSSLKVIQNLTGYIYHCFNPSIPILAVKLLKKFAMESPRSLFPCMAKERDIVREMFVKHLESRLVSDALKEALIELVISCCDTQPGMTESLFHVYTSPNITVLGKKMKSEDKPTGGVLIYLCSFLGKLNMDPSLVCSSLYNVVVDLFYTIWLGEMVSVIEYLRVKENFWTDFCSPLFQNPEEYSNAYPKIFNVLTIELHRIKVTDGDKFISVLKKFFNANEPYLNNWSQYIMTLCNNTSEPRWDIGLNKYIFTHSNLENKEVIISEYSCPEHLKKNSPPLNEPSKQPDNEVSSGKRKSDENVASEHNSTSGQNGEKNKKTVNLGSTNDKSSCDINKDSLPVPTLITCTLSKVSNSEKVKVVSSWKQFLVMALNQKEIVISSSQREFLTRNIMASLQKELGNSDLKLFIVLAEAYLLLTSNWSCTCFCDNEANKNHFLNLLHFLVASYHTMSKNIRELILAVLIQLYDRSHRRIKSDDVATEATLQSISSIVIFELTDIGNFETKISETGKENQNKGIYDWSMKKTMDGSTKEPHKPLNCSLSLCLLRKFLIHFEGQHSWLNHYRCSNLIPTLFSTYGKILINIREAGMVPHHFDVAISIINIVLLLLHKNFSETLLRMDMKSVMWLELLPPKTQDTLYWTESNWKLVYGPSLEVFTWMLSSQGTHFLEDAISFAGIHEEYLVASISSVRHTLKGDVLDLTVKVLNFVRVLSEYKQNWIFSHEHSHKLIIDGVKGCLYSCAALLIHPTLLKMIVKQPHSKPITKISSFSVDETESTPEVIAVQNRLLEIAILCLLVLKPCSPQLLPMFKWKNEDFAEWQPIIEAIFSTPMLDEDTPLPLLTFGALITMINICSQALTKSKRSGHTAPSTPVKFSSASSGLSTLWVSTLDKRRCSTLLELSLELLVIQGILQSAHLSHVKREMFHRNLSMEMTLYLEYAKRFSRESAVNKVSTSSALEPVPRHLTLGSDVDQIAAAMVPLKRSLSDPNRTLRRSLISDTSKDSMFMKNDDVIRKREHSGIVNKVRSPVKSPGYSPRLHGISKISTGLRYGTDFNVTPTSRSQLNASVSFMQSPGENGEMSMEITSPSNVTNMREECEFMISSIPTKSLSDELYKLYVNLAQSQKHITSKHTDDSHLPTLYEDVSISAMANTEPQILIDFKNCSSENYCQFIAHIINNIFM